MTPAPEPAELPSYAGPAARRSFRRIKLALFLSSMAACLFILVSQQLAALPFGAQEAMRVDPLRLIEAVTAGVAFLAAGTIFTSGGQVHNITTGASMWMAGAIGLACGSGQMPLAAMATGIVLLVLYVIRLAEK